MKICKFIGYFILCIEYRLRVHIFPAEIYVRAAYLASFGRVLKLDRPTAFTEKLQWMKIYDKNPLYTYVSDKLNVKAFIGSVIGSQYTVDTLGCWETPNDINLKYLPQKFVVKCTHDCESMAVFDQSIDDWKKVTNHLRKCLTKNYYYTSREWCYRDVKPRIIAEPFLEDNDGKLWDYKFFCFNGKVLFFKIDFDRFGNHRANYYSPIGKYLDFGEAVYPRDPYRKVNMPHELPLMIYLAEKLAEAFYFIRVDMYNIDGIVKVGELTLYPGSGFLRYDPDEWDYRIGNYLKLPVDTFQRSEHLWK